MISKKIKLRWMELIRKRLEEDMKFVPDRKFIMDASVMDFIKPILKYGEAEEKRIQKEFKKAKNSIYNLR